MRIENLKRPLANEKGMVLMASIMLGVVLSILAVAVLAQIENKNKIQKKIDLSSSAFKIKENLMTAFNSKMGWTRTKNENQTKIALFNSGASGAGGSPSSATLTPIKIDIYSGDNPNPVVVADQPTVGFTFDGQICTGFNENEGNDLCPFRYEISLKTVTQTTSDTIIKVMAFLKFKPADSKYVLNTLKSDFTFEYTPSFESQSANDMCLAIGGYYNTQNLTCTHNITNNSANCPSGNSYRGPAAESNLNCDQTKPASTTCTANQYVVFDQATNEPSCKAFN